MRLSFRVLIAILSVALFAPNTATSQTASEEDRAALMALYDATNGVNWTNSTNWGSSRPIGEWHGVVTHPNGRVTELELVYNQLTGEIPAALAQFESTINPQQGGVDLPVGSTPVPALPLRGVLLLGLLLTLLGAVLMRMRTDIARGC